MTSAAPRAPAGLIATHAAAQSAPSVARERLLQRLADETFDILIVGGGATGAGIARDAALRGLRVALCEHSDFAAETSSRSSKLIHGGLRYVQYGDFHLVFEALAERRTLMRTAPHLCRPLEFLFPAYRNLTPGLRTLGAGITVYNALAAWRPPARSRRLTAREVYDLAPGLRAAGLEGGQLYVDCRTDDARLVLATTLDAASVGAAVASHVTVERLLRDGRGRARAAQVVDRIAGVRLDIRAKLIVNATGPYSDTFARESRNGRRHLRPTLGVHLVFDAARLPHADRATVLRSPRDGRLVFLLPAGARTILGTTDTDWDAAGGDSSSPKLGDSIAARRSDVEYLLEVANHAYPPAALRPDDVISTFAGLRPLIAAPAHTASATSREHELFTEPDGVLTIAGGKLTTYRRMAEQVVDRAVEILRDRGLEQPLAPCTTSTRPLPGGDAAPPASVDALELAPAVTAHLLQSHGSRVTAVGDCIRQTIAGVTGSSRIDPELPYLWGEVIYAARHERVEQLDDVLVRRVPIFRDARDQGLAAAPRAAAVLGEILGWPRDRRDAALEAYRHAVAISRSWAIDG